jgi:hypothetical protein
LQFQIGGGFGDLFPFVHAVRITSAAAIATTRLFTHLKA